ncbi:MAG: hypothetical protein IKJ73_03385 [Lachnospiraceae bacterium]|nr:hypothetical protein [Lachnospiraceae bacterium]
MDKKITKKRYYRISFALASPLAIGSGENTFSDKDIVRDGNGSPYVPGSSLAGVYRALFDQAVADKYFGYIQMGNGATNQSSKIITYDAVMCDKEYYVANRDCVKLDEWKVAMKGSKFDFEVLEPGVKFVTYIEQNLCDGDELVSDVIAKAWRDEEICLGAKTMRGLGSINKVSINSMDFDFENPASLQAWLDFDMYDAASWDKSEKWQEDASIIEKYADNNQSLDIVLDLVQEGPLVIRVYTTEISNSKDESLPDYKQICYMARENGKEIPFIPGTSWAGVFRHRISESDKVQVGAYFGEHGDNKTKSRISFSESVIRGSKAKDISRNAIDRFTGGTVDTALFKEKVVYGGETKLNITVKGSCDEEFKKSLASAIVDLHMGFMTVGGETAVGYGLFSIKKAVCNEKDIKIWAKDEIYSNPTQATTMYNNILEALNS